MLDLEKSLLWQSQQQVISYFSKPSHVWFAVKFHGSQYANPIGIGVWQASKPALSWQVWHISNIRVVQQDDSAAESKEV